MSVPPKSATRSWSAVGLSTPCEARRVAASCSAWFLGVAQADSGSRNHHVGCAAASHERDAAPRGEGIAHGDELSRGDVRARSAGLQRAGVGAHLDRSGWGDRSGEHAGERVGGAGERGNGSSQERGGDLCTGRRRDALRDEVLTRRFEQARGVARRDRARRREGHDLERSVRTHGGERHGRPGGEAGHQAFEVAARAGEGDELRCDQLHLLRRRGKGRDSRGGARRGPRGQGHRLREGGGAEREGGERGEEGSGHGGSFHWLSCKRRSANYIPESTA